MRGGEFALLKMTVLDHISLSRPPWTRRGYNLPPLRGLFVPQFNPTCRLNWRGRRRATHSCFNRAPLSPIGRGLGFFLGWKGSNPDERSAQDVSSFKSSYCSAPSGRLLTKDSGQSPLKNYSLRRD